MATETDNLLLAIQTTADLAGVRAVKEGISGIPAAIQGMSTASRQAFNAMDADAKRAAMTLLGVSQAEQTAFLGMQQITGAVSANTSAVNVNIGAFVKRGELVNRNSVQALNAYRAEGDALSVLLAKMGATEAELNRIGAAIGKVEQAAGAGTVRGVGQPRDDEALKKVPGSARTAANALAMLSSAALTGSGSVQGLMVAAGGLTTGLAALSTSARVAAAATGIGALVTVAAVVGLALYRMGDAAKASKLDIERLNNYSAATIGDFVDGLKAENDRLVVESARRRGFMEMMNAPPDPGKGFWATQARQIKEFLGITNPALTALQKNLDLTEQATKHQVKLEAAERRRLNIQRETIADDIRMQSLRLAGDRATAGSLDNYAKQHQALITNREIEEARIRLQFQHRDEFGKIVPLTETQRGQMQKLLDINFETVRIKRDELAIEEQLTNAAYKRAAAVSGAAIGMGGSDIKAQYEAKEAVILAEAELDIRRGRHATDVEKATQAKIVELRRATMNAARDDAKTIVNVLLESGSRQVKAIGHAADTVRRIEIGAQAAKAGVESAIEFARAIGSAAAMDWRGAALHAASGLALAKAAALGAKESLGGGGGAGSGGGGGAADTGGTFRPRTGTEGQGGLTINLITQDPYGAQHIQQVMHELNRAEVLKRPPIPIPPTTGIGRAA